MKRNILAQRRNQPYGFKQMLKAFISSSGISVNAAGTGCGAGGGKGKPGFQAGNSCAVGSGRGGRGGKPAPSMKKSSGSSSSSSEASGPDKALTNGMKSHADGLKKADATTQAKELRAKGVHASVMKGSKGYSVMVPEKSGSTPKASGGSKTTKAPESPKLTDTESKVEGSHLDAVSASKSIDKRAMFSKYIPASVDKARRAMEDGDVTAAIQYHEQAAKTHEKWGKAGTTGATKLNSANKKNQLEAAKAHQAAANALKSEAGTSLAAKNKQYNKDLTDYYAKKDADRKSAKLAGNSLTANCDGDKKCAPCAAKAAEKKRRKKLISQYVDVQAAV